MTLLSPHPYQADAIERCRREVGRSRRRILLVMPTGAGKTVCAALILAGVVAKGRRALFLAHRRELITQARDRIGAAGIDAGIILPGFPSRPDEPVQIASVQSFDARILRSSALDSPEADVVVVDEAHHSRAATYEKIIAQYPKAIVLGLTATPCRGDGKGLGNCFDVLVEGPSVQWLTDNGFLVPAICFAPTTPDLAGVKVRRGDYAENELAERMDKPKLVGDIVVEWHRLGQRRSTVVFATSVSHSVHLRDEFRRSGVLAEHLDASTPTEERDTILDGLKSGVVEVVCNVGVLTEGWDQPAISCCVLARPTKSLGLFRQMVGRVLRTHPGKQNALIIDHAGACYAHGVPADDIAWDLLEDKRATNKTRGGSAQHGGTCATLAECPECRALRNPGKPCPGCGWKPTARGAEVEVAEGELGLVGSDRVSRKKIHTAAEKLQFQGELTWVCRERGYGSGWIANKFREKFGHWPHGDAPMVEPSPQTRSWVKSRQIAYVRGMQRARVAS